MSRSTYDIGDVVELQARSRTRTTRQWTPGTVKVTVKRPSGAETMLTYLTDQPVTKVSTDVYTYAINLDQSGIWYYRWQGTGSNAAAAVGEFEVRKTPFSS